jgi:hypothetical protein
MRWLAILQSKMIRSLLMLLLLLAITFALITLSWGEEIMLKWRQPEGQYPTTQWHIYRVHPLPRMQIAVAEQTHCYVEANDGDKLVITAVNIGGESDDSPPWIVRLSPANPLARVTVQTSPDMVEWTDHQAFDFDEPAGKFFRLKIEKP